MEALEGRTAVITGGASGIGLALARRLGAEGMKVVIADIEAGALDAAADTLAGNGVEVLAVPTDVSDPRQIEALADAVDQRFGGTHLLCNNAGVVAVRNRVWATPPADWDWVLGVDLHAVFHGIRVFVPRMLAAGGPGHVVNTASTAGLLAFPGISPYNVAKVGVVALSETLALELRSERAAIGVSVLCPGVVATGIGLSQRNRPGHTVSAEDVEAHQRVANGIGETLEPEEVADLVLAAVRTDRFWVLPHPRYGEMVIRRARGITETDELVRPTVQ